MTIHSTTIEVTVLHQNGPGYSPQTLQKVVDDAEAGNIILGFIVTEDRPVPAERVEGALLDIGNDGTWFGDEYLDLANAEPVIPDYEMYTPEGNAAVHAAVLQAVAEGKASVAYVLELVEEAHPEVHDTEPPLNIRDALFGKRVN